MSQEESKRSFVGKVIDRRVPQLMGIYLGAGWAVLEFIQYIVGRYSLSPNLEDVALVLILSMVPSMFVVFYFHGKGEWHSWTRVEKYGIPANLILTAALMFFLFGNKSFSSATTTVQATDEDGKQITRQVASKEFRRQILIYPFANKTGDDALNAPVAALPEMLRYDLSQDIFISALTTLYSSTIRRDMRERDQDPRKPVPLTLARQMADNRHIPWFLTGEVSKDEAGYVAEVALYKSETGKVEAEITVRDPQLISLMDQVHVELIKAWQLPAVRRDQVTDLPLTELVTTSEEALGAYADMYYHQNWTQNLNKALEAGNRAVTLDESFALAYYNHSFTFFQLNRMDEARQMQAKAERLDYKFTEDYKLALKNWRYQLDGEEEKRLKLLRMRVELAPEDVGLKVELANSLATGLVWDEALDLRRQVQEMVPNPEDYALGTSRLYENAGRYEEALKYLEEYVSHFPNEANSFGEMARFHLNRGNFEEAMENIDKALVLDNSVNLKRLKVTSLRNTGQWDEAEKLMQRMLSETESIATLREISMDLLRFYSTQGRAKEAIEIYKRGVRDYAEVWALSARALAFVNNVPIWNQSGREEEAAQILADYKKELEPPLDTTVDFGYVFYYLDLEQTDKAEEVLIGMKDRLDALRFSWGGVHSFELNSKMRIHQQRGELDEAFEIMEEIKALTPENFVGQSAEASLLLDAKRYDASEKLLKKLLKVGPYNTNIMVQLARICEETDRVDEAIGWLEKALEVWVKADPEYIPASEARADIARLKAGNAG